jgi:hypothetical protein
MATRSSADEYAAAEVAWQRNPARAELARQNRQIPASWRKVDIPTIRLDADTPPRITVTLPRRAYDMIEAACIRSGGLETLMRRDWSIPPTRVELTSAVAASAVAVAGSAVAASAASAASAVAAAAVLVA